MAQCLRCEEEVLPFEQDSSYSSQPMHIECGARGVVGSVGHQLRWCSCYPENRLTIPDWPREDPPGVSKREAARQAYRLFQQNMALERVYGEFWESEVLACG